jgi:hypothetical protein
MTSREMFLQQPHYKISNLIWQELGFGPALVYAFLLEYIKNDNTVSITNETITYELNTDIRLLGKYIKKLISSDYIELIRKEENNIKIYKFNEDKLTNTLINPYHN